MPASLCLDAPEASMSAPSNAILCVQAIMDWKASGDRNAVHIHQMLQRRPCEGGEVRARPIPPKQLTAEERLRGMWKIERPMLQLQNGETSSSHSQRNSSQGSPPRPSTSRPTQANLLATFRTMLDAQAQEDYDASTTPYPEGSNMDDIDR